MKESLVERTIRNGRLADELGRSEGFQELLKKASEKREQLLKEAIGSKTLDELRFKAGFVEGLDFLIKLTGQWSQRAKKLRKN